MIDIAFGEMLLKVLAEGFLFWQLCLIILEKKID